MKRLVTFLFFSLVLCFDAASQVEEIKFFKRTNEFAGARVLDNDKILFSAQDDNGNSQLWVTDGTAAGTKQLSDPCPSNTFSNFYNPYSSSYGFFSDGSNYISIMNTACSGQILKVFKTDGNAVSYSTQTNKDFGSSGGNDWSKIYDSVIIGDKIFFFALAKNIYSYDKNTGNVAQVYSNNDKYPVANNDIHYLGKDGSDLLLYFYNPHILVRFNTNSNTVSQFFDIKQYYQDALGYDAKPTVNYIHNAFMKQEPNIYSWNGSNYFIVTYQEKDFVTSYALWKTDGTAGGTVELHRFTRGKTNIDRSLFFTPFNGKLYFRFSDKTNSGLWMTDGTAQGTGLVKALNTDTNYHSADNVMSNIAVVNNKLYFFGLPAASQDYELFESDGSAAGTQKAFEFIPGSSGLMERNNTVPYIYTYRNRLFWMSSFFSGGSQIMTSDGTINGTYSLGGGFRRSISPIVFNNGYAYFSGQKTDFSGSALYRVALDNQRPFLLSSVSGNIAKGGTITVTGFDLRGASRVDLFLPDGNQDSYGIGSNVQQINDTSISFTVSSNLQLSSFRIAVNTPQGTFLSKQAYSTGTGIADGKRQSIPYSVIQSAEQVIINFNEVNKSYDIKLVDMTGKVLESNTRQNEQKFILDKKLYKPGIYILQINNSFAEKIVVQ